MIHLLREAFPAVPDSQEVSVLESTHIDRLYYGKLDFSPIPLPLCQGSCSTDGQGQDQLRGSWLV